MEEEIKKRGRGRPRKGEVVPKPKKKRKNERRGGAREGAGRKTAYGGELLSATATFVVREITKQRINQLRELTKHDDMPFNRLFEAWVEELAKNYGLEDE